MTGFFVQLRYQNGAAVALPPFVTRASGGEAEWIAISQEIARSGVHRSDGEEPWGEFNIILVLTGPLSATGYDLHMLKAVRRAAEHSWGARILVATVGPLQVRQPHDAAAVGRWINVARENGAHGLVGLPSPAREPRDIEPRLLPSISRALERDVELHQMRLEGGPWRVMVANLSYRPRQKLYDWLNVEQLRPTQSRPEPFAVIERDGEPASRRELGPGLDINCAWELEAFDFIARLLSSAEPSYAALRSDGHLLLTSGFRPDHQPDQANCLHASAEIARLRAILPAARTTVWPGLTVTHFADAFAPRLPSPIRVWVHAGNGKGASASLGCADGGSLERAQMLATLNGQSPELVILSACKSEPLGAELFRSGIPNVIAYPHQIGADAAHLLSVPMVRAFFESGGDAGALRKAFTFGCQEQLKKKGLNYQPHLFQRPAAP